MQNKKTKNVFEDWIKKANEDEISIKAILIGEGSPSTACFLSQQMSEKYLKAFLVYKNETPPKIHFLDKLLKLCGKIDAEFLELKDEVVLLSEYYTTTRYPGDYPEGFSWKMAKEAYAAAEKIKDFVLERIGGKV